MREPGDDSDEIGADIHQTIAPGNKTAEHENMEDEIPF